MTEGSTILLSSPSAETVLINKTVHWNCEKEYRIISDQQYFNIKGKITGIYMGIRIIEQHKELLEKTVPKTIPIIETKLCLKTIKIEPNNLL